MTTDAEISRVRDILVASCEAWLASGKRIAPGAFRGLTDASTACAVGTLPECDDDTQDRCLAAANALGLKYAQVMKIGFGFDGDRRYCPSGGPFYALGAELRRRYAP